MYKTIRHGENSLQYTILPQNDDFRIEGKLTSAENNASANGSIMDKSRKFKHMKNGSTSSSSSTTAPKRAPRRRSFFAYLGLIFVCTVIVGAVLIPFLVSTECLPSPTEWFFKTKAAFIKSGIGGATQRDVNVTRISAAVGDVGAVPLADGANIGKTVRIVNQNGVEKFILKVNRKTSSDQQQQRSWSQLELQQADEQTTIPPMAAVLVATLRSPSELAATKTATVPATFKPRKQIHQHQTIAAGGSLLAPRIPAYAGNQSGNQSSSSVVGTDTNPIIGLAPTITTRIIQVPLLKSTAKRPVMPPVLAKTISQPSVSYGPGAPPAVPALQTSLAALDVSGSDGPMITAEMQQQKIKHQQQKETTETNSSSTVKTHHVGGWVESHLPFIDPSSFVQWVGIKAEDSVLLPALLGFALIGIIFIIAVCMVARNKRCIVSSLRKRNRNDIEEKGTEDNATLLTTTSLSDDD